MNLIIIAGMPGAGKEELLSVAKGMNIPFIRMGDIVREYHSNRPSEDANLSVGQFAGIERNRRGSNIWAKRALDRMYGNIFLVDGCRSMEEILAYRELSNAVNIIGIHSSPKTRYTRLVKRARDDAPANIDEFNARDNREISWGLAEVIALSDLLIVNEGTLQDFYSDAANVIRKVLEI